MMPNASKNLLEFIRLKCQLRIKSSLNSQLLTDVVPTVELSDYRRLPDSDIENPSELPSPKGLKSEPIADLDLFFGSLYTYYCGKGLTCIAIKWIVELLTIIFVLGFIWFFLLVIDWHALRDVKCGIEAVESGQKPCDLAKEVINHHPLTPFTFTKGVIVGCMVILTIYGLFNFLKFFVQFRNTLRIRHFYYSSLNVTDHEMRTSSWPAILEKVVKVQKEQQLCVVKDLSAHDIIMRIMRKENYLIGMVNKGVLALPVSWWIPGVGPYVCSKESGGKKYLLLPKTLEWTLNWCIFQSMFDSKFYIQKDFIANPSLLRKRLMVIGIIMFMISPCLVIFMLVYLFLWHAEQFYNHPRTASSRRWSNLTKLIFREFNEVDHFFRHRLNSSVVHASHYLNQFPSPLISTVAKFISFVSGGFAAILIIIAFLDESLLEGHVFGRNLFWYAAIFGTVTAIARALVTDELHVLDHEGAMSLVGQHTHYMPKRWRGRENNDTVRAEFETLFPYAGMMLFEEMASIFITPFLLVFVVPKRVDDLLQFISDYTVDIEGVGHVCSLSLFDFERHGNIKYASPFNASKDMRSSQGKMEKSFLSFQRAYPTWEPSAHGKQFLEKLCNCREQQLQTDIQRDFSPIQTRQFCHGGLPIPSCGPVPDLNTLDCFYVSPSLHSLNTEVACESSSEPWRRPYDHPPYRDENLEIREENDGYILDRSQSHLEASTSSPFFRNNSFHQYSIEQGPAMDTWWARANLQSFAPRDSFLDPPVFSHHNFRQRFNDELSEKSFFEEQDKILDNSIGGDGGSLRPLWKTTYMDDDGEDESLGLHFAFETKNGRSHTSASNAYGNHLGTLPVRIIPRSNDPVE